MALDLAFVAERLDPAHPVWIRPYGIINAREIRREFAASLLEKMGQEKTHLEERERKLSRIGYLVPLVRRRRHKRRRGNDLVERRRRRPARRRDRADEHRQQFERARHLPSAEIARRGVAPDMRGESMARATYLARHLHDRSRI